MRAPVMRASALQAAEDDQDLEAIAASGSYEDSMRAAEEVRKLGESATAQEDYASVWGHGNARRHVWQSEATEEASKSEGRSRRGRR